MSTILERALVAILNEEKDQAKELIHEFVLARSNQIHESMRQDEELNLNDNQEQKLSNGEMLTTEGWDDDDDDDDEFEQFSSDNPTGDVDEKNTFDDLDKNHEDGPFALLVFDTFDEMYYGDPSRIHYEESKDGAIEAGYNTSAFGTIVIDLEADRIVHRDYEPDNDDLF